MYKKLWRWLLLFLLLFLSTSTSIVVSNMQNGA
jgi:hypothetical protein